LCAKYKICKIFARFTVWFNTVDLQNHVAFYIFIKTKR
jgi:hypothetical protein